MLGIWVLLFAVAALSGLVGIRLARAVGGDSPWSIEASSGLDGPHDTNTHAAGSPIHTVLTGSDISEAFLIRAEFLRVWPGDKPTKI